jgi:hypothetical protein
MGKKLIAILLVATFSIPIFLDYSPEKAPVFTHTEQFDPSYSRLNSVRKLEVYADSVAAVRRIKPDSLAYGILVANILRKRFYHGFSAYSCKENWLASLAQYCFGHNLAYPVIPDDILKFPYAGCSQQAIVLMKVMRDKNIPYRSVGFPHHYATELFFGHDWYFFDPDMEPIIKPNERMETSWKESGDSIKKYYSRFGSKKINWAFGNSLPAIIGHVNADPAPHAEIFQVTTKYLSKLLWIFPFLFIVFYKQKQNLFS